MKYGESYESLANRIRPYLSAKETATYNPNIYPIFWDKTITVYNRYETTDNSIIWVRTVLANCFVKNIGTQKLTQEMVATSNTMRVRIPQNNLFVESKEWTPANGFTLQIGDIIVNGEVDFEIEEYTDGYTANDLLEKYKGYCLTINQVTIDTGTYLTCPHYNVLGE